MRRSSASLVGSHGARAIFRHPFLFSACNDPRAGLLDPILPENGSHSIQHGRLSICKARGTRSFIVGALDRGSPLHWLAHIQSEGERTKTVFPRQRLITPSGDSPGAWLTSMHSNPAEVL